jgi:hypothetical protein
MNYQALNAARACANSCADWNRAAGSFCRHRRMMASSAGGISGQYSEGCRRLLHLRHVDLERIRIMYGSLPQNISHISTPLA